MMIVDKLELLPDKIRNAIGNRKKLSGNIVFSFKTLLKPNDTIPILWFTVFSDGIALLSTHKTRNVYKEWMASEVNSIRIIVGAIDIISNDLNEDDMNIPIGNNVDIGMIGNKLVGYSIIK